MDIGLDWQQLLLAATALSLLAFLATAIGVPWAVTRLPHDYFSSAQRSPWRESAEESLRPDSWRKEGSSSAMLTTAWMQEVEHQK